MPPRYQNKSLRETWTRAQTTMKRCFPILTIGIIEILIGSTTLISNIAILIFSQNNKSLNVLCFVFIAGIISTLLGIGILKYRKEAYQLLLYFSSVIILSKILIFMDIIHLNGALETAVPSSIKNMASIVYHGFVIVYLCEPKIKQIFYSKKSS